MTTKVRVLAGLSEITLEKGNKIRFIESSHSRTLYSHKCRGHISVHDPGRFRGQEGNCC